MNAKKAKLVRRKARELAKQINAPSQIVEHIGGGYDGKQGHHFEWQGERRIYQQMKGFYNLRKGK